MEKRAVFVAFHLPPGEKKGKSKNGNFLQRRETDWMTLVINTIIIVLRITIIIVLKITVTNISRIIIVIITTSKLIFLGMFELVGNPGGNKQRPCLGGFSTNGELWHISATSALKL